MNYDSIKGLARAEGVSVRDLLALAPQNDPFYVGQDAQLAGARWFAGWWERLGYAVRTGIHLRRVHYALVSQDPPAVKPGGAVYENTLNDWAYLGSASKWARYLGLTPVDAFIDRRNPEALLYARQSEGAPAYGYTVAADDWPSYRYALPDMPSLRALPDELPEPPNFETFGYHPAQPYLIELWAEKTTMNDVLEPLCRRYRANLVTGAGELSITAVRDFMDRVHAAGRPARILYISDFDPAGLGMPISVARKIEYFQRSNGDAGLDIRLRPVVLTAEQVSEYNLPRVPVKDTDRRKANFEAAHGEGQVELDALEALHPGELARTLAEAILDYYDPSLDERTEDAAAELDEALADARAGVLAAHAAELEALAGEYGMLLDHWEQTRDAFAELARPFAPRVEAHRERLEDLAARAQDLNARIGRDLAAVGIDAGDYAPPDADLPDEPAPLYDSELGYLEQLVLYRVHRGGRMSENVC